MSVSRFFLSTLISFFFSFGWCIVPGCNYSLELCFFLLHLLCLQGELEVVKEIPDKMIADKKENSGDQSNTEKLSDGRTERYASVKEASKMPFLMLGLDLPPPPLFKDVMEKNIIPQVLLHLMLLCLLHMKCCSWYILHWGDPTLKPGYCYFGCNCCIQGMYV